MATYLKLQNTFNPENKGKLFEIERTAAEHSALVCMLFTDLDEEVILNDVIPVPIEVSDDCLAKVFEWMTRWKDMAKVAEDDADKPIIFTDWDEAFFCNIDSQMLYEILVASNYLEVKLLYDMACQKVVDMIRGKTTEEIRQILDIENDFTPEQEAAIRQETAWAYDREETAEGAS
jgi:S-phase kinase-associated protein 1